ncbi:hypothetical protein ACFL1K_05090 [Candidatus Omnitrophota bacterium]
MNRKFLIVFLAISASVILAAGLVFANGADSSDFEVTDEMFWLDRYMLILKSTTDYNEALDFAVKASEKLDLEFKHEYKDYSREKGIYFTEDLPDPDYKGLYWPRRYEGEHISLENSGAYGDAFAPGYIIVVGGVYSDREKGDKALSRAKELYKDSYLKKTNMWMGCIH